MTIIYLFMNDINTINCNWKYIQFFFLLIVFVPQKKNKSYWFEVNSKKNKYDLNWILFSLHVYKVIRVCFLCEGALSYIL